jgi:hypothetical protein
VLYQSSCGRARSGRPEDCRSACRSSRLSFGVASAFHHPVASPIADTHSSTSRPVLRCVDGSQRLGRRNPQHNHLAARALTRGWSAICCSGRKFDVTLSMCVEAKFLSCYCSACGLSRPLPRP